MEEKKEILLTQEGYQKLEDELEILKTVRRREVADRIKVAISFGDISVKVLVLPSTLIPKAPSVIAFSVSKVTVFPARNQPEPAVVRILPNHNVVMAFD